MIMKDLKKGKFYTNVVDYFNKFPFYKTYIKKRKIKHLKNIDLLSELPFY